MILMCLKAAASETNVWSGNENLQYPCLFVLIIREVKQ